MEIVGGGWEPEACNCAQTCPVRHPCGSRDPGCRCGGVCEGGGDLLDLTGCGRSGCTLLCDADSHISAPQYKFEVTGEHSVNIEKLENCLEPWIRVQSWHTYHPLDKERFYKSLRVAIEELGPLIEYDDFVEAMTNLVKKHHPKMLSEYANEYIEKLSATAEGISQYVHFTSGGGDV